MAADHTLDVRFAEPDDAPVVWQVIRTAFSARPPIDPPAEAMVDTVDDVRSALTSGWGLLVEDAGQPVGCLLVRQEGDLVTLRRVSVVPEAHGRGVAADMVDAALTLAAQDGATRAELATRREFPHLRRWWEKLGFRVCREHPHGHILQRRLPVVLAVPDAGAMQRLGEELATLLRAGDVVVATGPLGAGKTTLTQGIGAGLGVEGPVTSPTFVLSRVHPSRTGGPALVHVDAYRLGGPDELADIDLETSLASSVTVVEWGEGKAEWLSPDRLEIRLSREPDSDARLVQVEGAGKRWDGALEQLRRFT